MEAKRHLETTVDIDIALQILIDEFRQNGLVARIQGGSLLTRIDGHFRRPARTSLVCAHAGGRELIVLLGAI